MRSKLLGPTSSVLPRPRFRVGLALRRRPRVWWALTCCGALVAALAVGSVVASAESTRRAWGASSPVVVAAHDIDAGSTLRASDVRVVHRPRAMLPPGALGRAPTGRTAHTAIFEGELVLDAHLAPTGSRGVAARVPEGSRGIAIPVEAGTAPPLEPGQLVDVIVVLPSDDGGSELPAHVVARDALVLDVAEDAVTVAVDDTTAPKVAAAIGLGAVTLALVGPDDA